MEVEPALSAWESDRSCPVRPLTRKPDEPWSSRDCRLITLTNHANSTAISRLPVIQRTSHSRGAGHRGGTFSAPLLPGTCRQDAILGEPVPEGTVITSRADEVPGPPMTALSPSTTGHDAGAYARSSPPSMSRTTASSTLMKNWMPSSPRRRDASCKPRLISKIV